MLVPEQEQWRWPSIALPLLALGLLAAACSGLPPLVTSIPILMIPVGFLVWRFRSNLSTRGFSKNQAVLTFFMGVLPTAFIALILEALISVVVVKILDVDPAVAKELDGDIDSSDSSKVPRSATFFLFLALTAFITAATVEESIKLWFTQRSSRSRPQRVLVNGQLLVAEPGYTTAPHILYASMLVAIGFSTLENFGYVSLALNQAKKSTSQDLLFALAPIAALERILISTPVHLLCTYLAALRFIYRLVRYFLLISSSFLLSAEN